MKLPFTAEQFFEIFRKYNLAVWPAQLLFYLLALLVIYFIFRKKKYSQQLIAFIASFIWLWMGIVYHLIFFTAINNAAYLFGVLFITQGLLFLWAGITGKLVFQFKMTAQGIAGILLVFFALVVYPLLGVLQSHRYPDAPGFGLPCPSTIFTFGLFLWTVRKPPVMLLIIPFLWSVVGFSASFSLGVKEDIGLLAAGLVTAAFMFTSKKN